MESADCHRRASDAEQSSWPYSVTIKEEPKSGACSVSEAAARAGLYAGHELKDELVVGPELLQPQDVVYWMEVPPLKQEHLEDIKQEPRQACAGLAPAPADRPGASSGERPRSGDVHHRKLALKACSVRLHRISVDNKQHSSKTCLQTLDPESSILRHSCVPAESKTNPKTIKKKNKLQDGTQKNMYSCDTCEEQFMLKKLLIKHMKMHTVNKTYSCEMCKRLFQSYKRLKRHAVVHIHTVKKVYQCKICNKPFDKRYLAIGHKYTHTGNKPYTCDICHKQFRLKSYLTKHIQLHADKDKPHSCQICKKKLRYESGHKDSQGTRDKSYSCGSCSKQLCSKASLEHKQLHTGTKVCEFCNKQFTNPSVLRTHKRVHTKDKPYICQICHKQFALNSTLSKHMLVHSGEKPFTCEICYKKFSQKPNLERHIQLHTGQKPHSCQTCNKKFRDKSRLSQHMRTHTGEKPYSCGICNGQFNQQSNLTRHMQRHHRPTVT